MSWYTSVENYTHLEGMNQNVYLTPADLSSYNAQDIREDVSHMKNNTDTHFRQQMILNTKQHGVFRC